MLNTGPELEDESKEEMLYTIVLLVKPVNTFLNLSNT